MARAQYRPWWCCSAIALLLKGVAGAFSPFSPTSKDGLNGALLEYVAGTTPGSYGGQNISLWDVSGIKDMDALFCGLEDCHSVQCELCHGSKASFNGDISGWNVAQVTSM